MKDEEQWAFLCVTRDHVMYALLAVCPLEDFAVTEFVGLNIPMEKMLCE